MLLNTQCKFSCIYSIQMANAHPRFLQNNLKIIIFNIFVSTVKITAGKPIEINRDLTETL